MKRLALAIVGGFAIPFLYTITVGPLSTYTENETLQWLWYIPVGWPKLILQRLVPLNAFPFRDEDSTALLIYIIGSDVVLYGLVSYFLLWVLSLSRRSKRTPPSVPPPPSVQH
jgi:hypothetical protein